MSPETPPPGRTARPGGRSRSHSRQRLAALLPLCILGLAACAGDSRLAPPEIRDRWLAPIPFT
jgi:hypothetical protein